MSPEWQKKLDQIKESIDIALHSGATPVAAFDADGTLWDMDMGENFFDYQVQRKLLPDLPPDPWGAYRLLHDQNTPAAFLWLAQINKGLPLEQVREWAQKAFDHIGHVPVFPHMREIIQHLQRAHVKIFIVTASIKWSVEPGARFLGIPAENVVGVATAVSNGLVTDRLSGVVTWREGKVQGLLDVSGGKKPFLSAGNTMGDLALLQSATHHRVVNCAVDKDHVNFETEQRLVAHAREHSWFDFSL
jgi:phosphoserine phosphatase